MGNELYILLVTAASIGFLHTILGPDHYIPFIMMSKAGKWSRRKTVWVTALSGLGHVMSSILLGAVGIAAGTALSSLEAIESYRGEIAAWLLISFGLVYFAWGMKQALKSRKHTHWHSHDDGILHKHEHMHRREHAHAHEADATKKLTPWVIFTIFVFGPCEALIPVLMFPAASVSASGIALVAAVFGVATILTMLSVVLLSVYSFSFVKLGRFEKYSHAAAGGIIACSGLAVQFLGL